MKNLYLKKLIILSVFILFLISLSSFPIGQSVKRSDKITTSKSGMKQKLTNMKSILNRVIKIRDRMRRTVSQAESTDNSIKKLLDNCNPLNPAKDISIISTKMRRRGFRFLRKLSVHNEKYYSVVITGMHPGSSIKLKPGTRTPFSLLVRLKGGELDFEKLTYGRYITKLQGYRIHGDTIDDRPVPVCSNSAYMGYFRAPIKVMICRNHITTVENARKAVDYLYDYHKNALSNLRSIRSWIEDKCAIGAISATNKRSLRRCSSSIINNIKSAFDKFEGYINGIKETIKKYEKCKKNEVLLFRKYP